jgi:hypothetical protein
MIFVPTLGEVGWLYEFPCSGDGSFADRVSSLQGGQMPIDVPKRRNARISCYTDLVSLKNVTVTLEERTARWARVRAAEADMSLSRWLGRLLEQQMGEEERYEACRLEFAELAPAVLRDNEEPYPTREQVHDRARLR